MDHHQHIYYLLKTLKKYLEQRYERRLKRFFLFLGEDYFTMKGKWPFIASLSYNLKKTNIGERISFYKTNRKNITSQNLKAKVKMQK